MRACVTRYGLIEAGHVSKDRVVEVVTEAVDANAAGPLISLKKTDALAGVEQARAGCCHCCVSASRLRRIRVNRPRAAVVLP